MSPTNGRSRHNWRRVSADAPCPVCNHPDWCALSADGALAKCMRVADGAWRSRTDKAGARYHLHRLQDASCPRQTSLPRPLGPEVSRAEPDLLNRVYTALMARLSLSSAHREALQARGLPDEEIERRGYRTLPVQGRARHASALHEAVDDALLSVPGFVVKAGKGGQR
jgi:hypothetical protein